MIVKIATHAVVFVVGAGAGIWWGVAHPGQAQQIATTESNQTATVRAEIAKAKADWLRKAATTSPSELANWVSDQKVQAEKDVKLSTNHLISPPSDNQ